LKPSLLFSALFAGAVALSSPAQSFDVSGAYLAGRQAAMQSDFAAAARYFSEALAQDSENPELLEDVMNARVLLGDVAGAAPVAAQLQAQGQRIQIAHMVTIADAIVAQDFAALLARDMEVQGIGPLVDGLLIAWAHIAEGDVDAVMAAFYDVAGTQGMGCFAMYHKAMALD